MHAFLDSLAQLLAAHSVTAETADLVAHLVGFLVLILLAVALNAIAKGVIVRSVTALIRHTKSKWDDAFVDAGVFTRLSHIAPALVFQVFGDDILGDSVEAHTWLKNFLSIYLIVIVLAVASAALNAIRNILNSSEVGARVPINGFVQAVKLVGFLVGGILVLSVVFGKSPFYFFSGLGALTAVLLLIFRDAILGFVAGIMISVNQMVRVGDWIEMPKAGADGDVIDVTLTTVKVRNWDKTITTIPTYNLISDSFKNWRGMAESGGRRIKRSLFLDLHTVRFADEALLARWQRIRRLRPYLEQKLADIAADNQKRGEDLGALGNGRRITNVGTFRAYCVAYLREHPEIHQDMTFLVRQLQPTEHGLPLEIYVFSRDTRWAMYEGIQADIFDHLLAVLGEFDLSVYQQPSGEDVRAALRATKAK